MRLKRMSGASRSLFQARRGQGPASDEAVTLSIEQSGSLETLFRELGDDDRPAWWSRPGVSFSVDGGLAPPSGPSRRSGRVKLHPVAPSSERAPRSEAHSLIRSSGLPAATSPPVLAAPTGRPQADSARRTSQSTAPVSTSVDLSREGAPPGLLSEPTTLPWAKIAYVAGLLAFVAGGVWLTGEAARSQLATLVSPLVERDGAERTGSAGEVDPVAPIAVTRPGRAGVVSELTPEQPAAEAAPPRATPEGFGGPNALPAYRSPGGTGPGGVLPQGSAAPDTPTAVDEPSQVTADGAEPVVPPFDTARASQALSGALAVAAGCPHEGSSRRRVPVAVSFAPSGRVTTARVTGGAWAGTVTGSCVAQAFRNVSMPPFAGGSVTVLKTVRLH